MVQDKIESELNKGGNKRGMHPNSRKNLRNDANPNGRPRKDMSLTSLLKEQLGKIPPGEKQGRTWRELLVLAWLTGAMKRADLLKELLERTDGKVVQPIGGEGGRAIPVRVIYEKVIKGGNSD